jgi:hypothetical protein
MTVSLIASTSTPWGPQRKRPVAALAAMVVLLWALSHQQPAGAQLPRGGPDSPRIGSACEVTGRDGVRRAGIALQHPVGPARRDHETRHSGELGVRVDRSLGGAPVLPASFCSTVRGSP